MKRAVLVLSLIAAAGVLAGLAWLARPGGDSGPEQAILSGPAEPAPLVPDAPAGASRAGGGLARDAQPGERASVSPGAAASAGAATLLVLARGDERPLIGAEVRFATSAQTQVLRDDPATGAQLDLEAWLGEHGERRVTDGAGTCLLPASAGADDRLLLSARHGDLWSLDTVRARPGGTILIHLSADRALEIQVVDGGGLPVAGVPVAIVLARSGWQQTVWSGRTAGARGAVAVTHAQQRFGRYSDRGALLAVLGFPQVEPPAVRFDPAEDQPEPLRLVLPPTGSARVELVGPGGAPFEGEARVELWGHPPAADPAIARARAAGSGTSTVAARGGQALFEHVGLGLQLHFDATPTGELRPGATEGQGPDVAGQELRFQVRLGGSFPVLVGRVVDATGEALAGYDLFARVVVPGNRALDGPAQLVRTDASGLFRVVVRAEVPPAERAELTLRATTRGRTADADARLDLPRPLPPGETDLGVVQLRGAPLIASGVVVDESGEPVERAMVVLQRGSGGEPGAPARWTWVDGERTGADGVFALYGALEPGEYGLSVSSGRHVAAALRPIAVGGGGLRIVLSSAGRIAGTVLVDEGVPADELQVRVTSLEGAGPSGVRISWAVAEDAHFDVGPLAVGDYDLALLLQGRGEPLARIEGVRVPAGRPSDDPRLREIDLRGLLRAIRLLVVGPGDAPVPEGSLRFWPAGAADGPQTGTAEIARGEAVLVTPWPQVDLDVRAPGLRRARLEGIGADGKVILRAGIPLRVRVGSPPELEPGTALWVRAFVPDGGAYPLDVALDGKGEALLHLEQPGPCFLSWWLQRREGPRPSSAHLRLAGETGLLELRDSSVEQVLDVELDRDALAEALRELDG